MSPHNAHLNMRERLIGAVVGLRDLCGSVNGCASNIRILDDESAERIVDAILDELREPDDAMEAAYECSGVPLATGGLNLMIDAIKGPAS